MAKQFLDYWNELIGYCGESMDPDLAKTLVQRAHKDILESRTWSFLVAEGVLQAPEVVTAGTVTVNTFDTVVTTDATAKTALDAAETVNIPMSTRQFRCGITGRIYNIASYNTTTGDITLQEPFSEADVAAGSYSVFKCFYAPPTADFLRFVTVRDLTNGRPLRLDVQKIELDRRDPLRTSTEPPMVVSTYKAASDSSPLFELWPRPTSARGYVTSYQKRGIVLTDDTDTLPASIPDELLMSRAQYHLAKWCEIAKGRDPALRLTNWQFLMAESLARYNELLHKAWVRDDEIYCQNVTLDKRLVYGPPSASYMQSHDTW